MGLSRAVQLAPAISLAPPGDRVTSRASTPGIWPKEADSETNLSSRVQENQLLRRRGVGRIWSPEEPSACYRKGLDAAYAGVRSNICPGRSGDLEGALARAVHDCHELAMSYKITDPLQDP